MTITTSALEAQIREDAWQLVRLEQDAHRAVAEGNVQAASEIWSRREVVRHRRSYLMRMLWAQQGVTR